MKKVRRGADQKLGLELDCHRNNARQILLWSNATPIRCQGGIGYSCSFCCQEFPNPADLKKHTLETHDDATKSTFMKGATKVKFIVKLDITDLQCNICKQNIDTIDAMRNHLKDVHDKKIFMDIKDHLLPFKFNDDTLRCVICSQIFLRFKSLQQHMNVHYRNYICQTCDAGFVSEQILFSHEKVHQTGQFKCDHCELIFETKLKRLNHVKRLHDKVAFHKCGYCNERFRENFMKVAHMSKVHGIEDSKIKCQACDKLFSTTHAYRIHTRRDHLMEKSHKCTQCDMAFFDSNRLTMHMVKHTGVKEFQCEVCQKFYSRRKVLWEHMKIHNNIRRHKCELCGMTFVQKCSWRGHMKSKHGEIV